MTFTQHPLSAAYPAMQANEYQALLDSITEIGVQNAITLFDGQVIDGWHRYKAATELGVACPTVELGDVDPRDFAKSQGARRNITASQNALAITAIYSWVPVGKPSISNSAVTAELPKTTKELAAIAGVGTRTIEHAKAVHAGAVQAVQDAVKTGAVSVETAAAVAKLPAKEQKKIAAKGAEAMRAAAKPVVQEEEGAPDQAEFDSVAAAEKAEQMAMRLLLASDEPLADMTAKYEQAVLQIERLNARIVGLQNQSTHQIKTIKSLQNKLKKLEQPA